MGEQYATAFWFNELVETSPDGDSIRQYLVTAGDPTRVKTAEFILRPELCAPAMSAEKLLVSDFAEAWTLLDDLGVAIMPTDGLHAHGDRKGWRWTTDEITHGIAATREDIADLGREPGAAYLLGHGLVAGSSDRKQAVVVGEINRTDGGGICWLGDLPPGCIGAPVFIGSARGETRFKLICVGVALPGNGDHPIAPFDRIRASLRALATPSSPATKPAKAGPRPPTPKRRWWQRR